MQSLNVTRQHTVYQLRGHGCMQQHCAPKVNLLRAGYWILVNCHTTQSCAYFFK